MADVEKVLWQEPPVPGSSPLTSSSDREKTLLKVKPGSMLARPQDSGKPAVVGGRGRGGARVCVCNWGWG